MPAEAEQERLRPLLGEVHRYWLGELASPTDLPSDKKRIWFEQSDMTDAYVREHFGEAIRQAANIDWDLEALSPQEQVGLVILLDQFPRNVFRNFLQAYAYDDKARSIAGALLSSWDHFALIERLFIAIPFEHGEAMAYQDRAVWLMAGIAVEWADSFPEYGRWALDSFIAHRELIRRFGRFPHRNDVLGRASTEEERAFLSGQPAGNASNPTAGLVPSRK